MGSGHRLFFNPSCHGSNMFFLGSKDSFFQGPRSLVMNPGETFKKQPFFSSPDELFDHEYYDEQSPEKKRRLTVEQVHMLEKSFEIENKLEPEKKSWLAKELGLQPRQVAVWFQNRRARWKTKQIERDYYLLKTSYDSLLSDYDSIRKENDKLKAEVVSLTEKLTPKDDVARGPTPDLLPADQSHLSSNSAVVDEVDGLQQQLGDSGDSSSYFPTDGWAYPVGGGVILSDGDNGSNDGGRIYFSDVYLAMEHQHYHEEHNDGDSFGWWVWS